jgi:hypothetical protein
VGTGKAVLLVAEGASLLKSPVPEQPHIFQTGEALNPLFVPERQPKFTSVRPGYQFDSSAISKVGAR